MLASCSTCFYRYDLRTCGNLQFAPRVVSRRIYIALATYCNSLHVFVASPLNEFRVIRIFREFLGIVNVRILFKTGQQRRTLRMTIRSRFCARIESSSCSGVRYAHDSAPLVPLAHVSWALEIDAMEFYAAH